MMSVHGNHRVTNSSTTACSCVRVQHMYSDTMIINVNISQSYNHATPSSSSTNFIATQVLNKTSGPLCVTYYTTAWSGMSSANDRARLDSLLRRGKRLGYCSNDVPTVTELFNSADDDFFYSVKTNSTHVLQPYLPDQTNIPYRLRTRPTT